MEEEPSHTVDVFRLERPPGAYGGATRGWSCSRGRKWRRVPSLRFVLDVLTQGLSWRKVTAQDTPGQDMVSISAELSRLGRIA